MSSKKKNTVEVINKKAKFEFHFLQELEVGIVLSGTEVKSLRSGNANLNDAYCIFRNDELYILSMYIGEYDHGNVNNHETRRERKLILKKGEIKKWQRRVTEKGQTIVPYKIYFSERGWIKLVIALAQGKKSYDKRDTIKQRDNKRELDRIKKAHL